MSLHRRNARRDANERHIIEALERAGVHYCCDETRLGFRRADNPSELTRELTAPLVAYKRAWARDMREMAEERGGAVDPSVQREAWRDCMRRAAAEVERVRARHRPLGVSA